MKKDPEYYSGGDVDAEYAGVVSGKRIALVGPANRTKGTLQRDVIENYDLIVRIYILRSIIAKIIK